MKPPLVLYHFETTENLLLALYRCFSQSSEAHLRQATAADNPLRAIWDFNANQEGTVLAAEFLALAHHRESIRTEMAAVARAGPENAVGISAGHDGLIRFVKSLLTTLT